MRTGVTGSYSIWRLGVFLERCGAVWGQQLTNIHRLGPMLGQIAAAGRMTGALTKYLDSRPIMDFLTTEFILQLVTVPATKG